ncbi:MAG TPA: tRNA pseudouridine(55) synthase TruB [Longimicrobiales bacterium]
MTEGVPEFGGVLLVDKPPGPTSHDVVDRARRVLGVRRVGHTGTLDPFASGLLLLCVGPATRLSEYLTGLDKEYRATARMGVATDTDDVDGEVVARADDVGDLDGAAVEAALERFRGPIEQRPPAFSAKKVAGVAAHRRARRGETVHLEPVSVDIHELELEDLRLPDVLLRVLCSSGTYVRALARDLGEELGVGAHLTALRRTAVGSFRVEDAVGLAELEAARAPLRWVGLPEALAHLPRMCVGGEEADRLTHGQRIQVTADLPEDGGPVAVIHEGRLVAVGEVDGGELCPRKVFA